jgi:site-specific DNA-methyltransferase (adenine-specific)
MQTIGLCQINVVRDRQRRIRRWKVRHIADKMECDGYNDSYPITLETDGKTLVDGGHRIEAARIAGIDNLPFITTDDDPIAHAIRCNIDGADTEPHDVFDLAELCYNLSESGMPGTEIAQKMGDWSPSLVTFYKQIKERLHPLCFSLASSGFTNNQDVVNNDLGGLVNQEFTIVNWRESHLREIVSEIPYTDRASYRAQLRTISQVLKLAGDGKKVTAAKIGKIAKRESWRAELGRVMRDGLVEDVSLCEWIKLYHDVRQNVFGICKSKDDLDKFNKAITTLNEHATETKLYHDDAARRIPQMKDDSIALVVTDPPYNVTNYDWDDKGTGDEYVKWLMSILGTLKPKLKKKYHIFMFCAPQYEAMIEIALRNEGWPVKSKVIWEYRNLVQGRDVRDKFVVNYQPCFHIGTHSLNWSPNWSDDRFAVQHHAAPQSNFKEGKDHPHQKPLDLIKLFVELGSSPGDTVIDFFAGSGTTGIACNKASARKCILIEQDDNYCSIIENKLKIKRVVEWQG